MGEYLTLFIGAVVVNNFVLTKFLGLCIFFGISKTSAHPWAWAWR